MAANGKHRIFLASSAELEADRRAFEIFINRVNKRWNAHGLFLELEIWEDFDSAVSPTRKQDDYNAALRRCDLFVLLFWTKVGKYTREEFEAALAQFKATGRPLIYTYCKNVAIPTSALNKRDTLSLLDFKERLDTLEHFPTHFDSVAALTGHFSEQLEKQAAKGFFGEAAKGGLPAGPGAQVVGPGGVIVNGDNHGSINTGGGGYFGGAVTAQQVIGGNQFNLGKKRDGR